MVKADPHERLSWNQFFNHPLIKNYQSYVEFQKALKNNQFYRINGSTLCCDRDLNSLQISRKMQNFPLNYPGDIEQFICDKSKNLFSGY